MCFLLNKKCYTFIYMFNFVFMLSISIFEDFNFSVWFYDYNLTYYKTHIMFITIYIFWILTIIHTYISHPHIHFSWLATQTKLSILARTRNPSFATYNQWVANEWDITLKQFFRGTNFYHFLNKLFLLIPFYKNSPSMRSFHKFIICESFLYQYL